MKSGTDFLFFVNILNEKQIWNKNQLVSKYITDLLHLVTRNIRLDLSILQKNAFYITETVFVTKQFFADFKFSVIHSI